MNGQLEDQTNEVRDVAEEIADALQAAFALLIERRDQQYASAVESLDTERENLVQESESIEAARVNLERLLPARAREAQRQADALDVAGDAKGAAAKIREAEEAANAPAAMIDRQREISARIEAVEAAKQAAAKRIFAAWYPEAQSVVRAAEHGLFCTLLDGLKASFYEFEAHSGTEGTIVRLSTLRDLTAPERFPEWNSGNRWYGGR